jgi:hypothetical protein
VIFSRINAATSPAGMKDRIPPRVSTPVTITVVNPEAAKKRPIIITVVGGSLANGTALLDGADTIEVTDSKTATLVGDLQSQPGGTLRLVATQGMLPVGSSNDFAVAAIPQDVTSKLDSRATGPADFGIIVETSWDSDSGRVSDLDRVTVEEKIDVIVDFGSFAGIIPSVQTTIIKGSSKATDDHTIKLKRPLTLSDAGSSIVDQVHAFADQRTGSPQLPIARSGFQISKEIKENPTVPDCLVLTVEKMGREQTVAGLMSEAGTTIPSPIEETVDLPCTKGGKPGGGTPGGGGGGQPGGGKGGPGGSPPVPTPAPGPGSQGPIIATPRPFKGKPTGGQTRFLYVSGHPKAMAQGEVFNVVIAFLSRPQDPKARPPADSKFGDRLLVATEVEFKVASDPSVDPVTITSTNEQNLNVAPEDHQPLVLSPGTTLTLRKDQFK